VLKFPKLLIQSLPEIYNGVKIIVTEKTIDTDNVYSTIIELKNAVK